MGSRSSEAEGAIPRLDSVCGSFLWEALGKHMRAQVGLRERPSQATAGAGSDPEQDPRVKTEGGAASPIRRRK